MRPPGARPPTLAQRLVELKALGLGNPQHRLTTAALTYEFSMGPPGGRMYRCRLVLERGPAWPEVLVLSPDLSQLAGGRELPHTYGRKGLATRLCLWRPDSGEWTPMRRLGDTVIAWTAEWLAYFEDWLFSDEWLGGGVHAGITTPPGLPCAAS
ncbi:hypothetical protein [Ramlibacter sp.]|uniref:hypothetical protein n=1 Tax=Ramlibacter sp. TaxID=1917967 RepID=UPI002D4C0675|nr:hypothetical protein [Ramlibacter sp.]HYD75305.1 hypothetical protein [Ramlibacter sp.]